MKITVLDEQGLVLTEITARVGRSPGHILVDWATRPDALFQYYFDRGSRAVTAVIGASEWSAVLGTRWQIGARCWFLHVLVPVRAPAVAAARACSTPDSAPGASYTRRSRAVRVATDIDALAATPIYEQRGILA